MPAKDTVSLNACSETENALAGVKLGTFPSNDLGVPVKQNWPLLKLYAHRCPYRDYGFEFGFWLAPAPREEHRQGEMIRALVHLDGFVSFKPWRWRVYWWFADPAERRPNAKGTSAYG